MCVFYILWSVLCPNEKPLGFHFGSVLFAVSKRLALRVCECRHTSETRKKKSNRQFLLHPLYKRKWKVKSFPTTINVIVYVSYFYLLLVVHFFFLSFFFAHFRIVRWQFTTLPHWFFTGISNTRHWTIFRHNHSIKYHWFGGQKRSLGVQSEESRKSNGESISHRLFCIPFIKMSTRSLYALWIQKKRALSECIRTVQCSLARPI